MVPIHESSAYIILVQRAIYGGELEPDTILGKSEPE